MGIKENEAIVSVVVTQDVKAMLRSAAEGRGLSLSKYMSSLLAHWCVENEPAGAFAVRRVREQHGSASVTIPPDIVEHLQIAPGRPLAFTQIPNAALIWSVK